MNLQAIEQEFREKVSDRVSITLEGTDRFRVFTPFILDDGDHLSIVLKREHGAWVLSDEGHTLMRLIYDPKEKDSQKVLKQENDVDAFPGLDVKDRAGELRVTIEDNRFGDALKTFVHALLKIKESDEPGVMG